MGRGQAYYGDGRCFRRLPGEDKEQVMGQFLESLEEMPPQDMAERILEFALSFVPGARDDMTVLTAQVWKR